MHVQFSCFSKSRQLVAHPVACKPGDSCSWMEFGQHVNVAFVLPAATCQMAAEEMTRSHFSLLISQCVAQCVSCWPHIILFTRILSLSQNRFCSYKHDQSQWIKFFFYATSTTQSHGWFRRVNILLYFKNSLFDVKEIQELDQPFLRVKTTTKNRKAFSTKCTWLNY